VVQYRAWPRNARKRPHDPIELAKLIGDIATGQVQDIEDDGKDPVRAESGRLGGKKGGKTRAAKLTPEQRKEIAQKQRQNGGEKIKAPSHHLHLVYTPTSFHKYFRFLGEAYSIFS